MILTMKGRYMNLLNVVLGYIILSIPALAVVLLFKRKSKKDLEKFENEYRELHSDKENR